MAARPFHEVRIAAAAFEDIANIWDWTLQRFGHAAALRYEALIGHAIDDLGIDPQRPGAKLRPDLLPGLWLYHLASSRARILDAPSVKSPRHFVMFKHGQQPGVIEILRILHDSRDLARHLPEE